MKYIFHKLRKTRTWNRILIERLTEPLHLNLISVFVWLFGSYRQKIAFDLVVRQQHAYPLLQVADYAKSNGIHTVSIIEFGVATGAGLLNIASIAQNISKKTGVNFKIYGFDTGKGMPKPESFKDHPEYYLEGDFKMNKEALEKKLPNNVHLIIGNVEDTIQNFADSLPDKEPVGFISFDLDYYSSTKSAFKILQMGSEKYLPLTYLYFDDIALDNHNEGAGEMLAIKEFNDAQYNRRIEHHRFLETSRIFRRAMWIRQIYYFHVMDHNQRMDLNNSSKKRIIENPYLDFQGNKESFKTG